MTKGELIKTLEGLNDDAFIYIGISGEPGYYTPSFAVEKITGDDLQNEITFICN